MKILVVQTAFIGDVILATSVLEALHARFPDAGIDFLVRRGNEGLVEDHPFIRNLLVWDKRRGKVRQLARLIRRIRAERYDHVVNLQRHLSTAVLTVLSGAGETVGFAQSPVSRLFTRRLPHVMSPAAVGVHEVDRDLSLVAHLTGSSARVKPRLYPRPQDLERTRVDGPYVTISPTSVWFTKQLPAERWVAVIDRIDPGTRVFLLGGPGDAPACERIRAQARHPRVEVMAGRIGFLEAAALMQRAAMNYVNDSAPLHMASATDAPVTAVFCSTVPAFGFGPLSTASRVVEVQGLACRPCGLHGRRSCPEGHFACADLAAETILGPS